MLTQAVNKQPYEAKQVHLHKAEKAQSFCSESFVVFLLALQLLAKMASTFCDFACNDGEFLSATQQKLLIQSVKVRRN